MSIIDQIAAAGVVGCGGAGFPADVKYRTDKRVEYLIMNAAECEPLLRTDRYIMRHMADRLIHALSLLKEECGAEHCVIALKEHYTEETAALEEAIRRAGAGITIHAMPNFYPAGDEQSMVYEVTGRVVPPGGIPIMKGAIVSNTGTVLAIADAIDGVPLTDKYLTVSGDVETPVILKVPVGTPVMECLRLAGVDSLKDHVLVMGGPMMGRQVTAEQAAAEVVTKTTSGLLVLPVEGKTARNAAVSIPHMLRQASSACIQCSYCTQLCPRNLLGHPLRPHMVMRKLALGGFREELLQDPDIRNAALCCECGVCEIYACPMGLMPRRVNHMVKGKLAEAGIRYTADPAAELQAADIREFRRVPSEKLAARAGVREWYHTDVDLLKEAAPDLVRIPLKMHSGAPDLPVVQTGDRVQKGDVIARPREGKLGALIHASISGRIGVVGDQIEIIRE